MALLSINFVFYITSLITLLTIFLLFIGLGGSFSAKIKSYLGDPSAILAGFGSINPLVHIDEFWILFYLLFNIFIRKSQPFSVSWKSGYKGIIERLIYIFSTPLFHLFFACIFLYIGYFWKGHSFLKIALAIPSSPSSIVIKGIKSIFVSINGISVIALLLILYGVIINITFALLNMFINLIDIFMNIYTNEGINDVRVLVVSYLAFFIIMYKYSGLFMLLFWRIIAIPLVFIPQV